MMWVQFLKGMWSGEKGEDLTEYALIIGLVSLAVIVGAGLLGGAFNTWYQNLSSWVSGLPVGGP